MSNTTKFSTSTTKKATHTKYQFSKGTKSRTVVLQPVPVKKITQISKKKQKPHSKRKFVLSPYNTSYPWFTTSGYKSLWTCYCNSVRHSLEIPNPDLMYCVLSIIEEFSKLQFSPVCGNHINLVLSSGDILFYVVLLQLLCADIQLDINSHQLPSYDCNYGMIGHSIAKITKLFQYKHWTYYQFIRAMNYQLNRTLNCLMFMSAESLDKHV